MGYDSIVCVKQVPDTANITVEAMKADGTVNRAALPAIFNPEDLHALETALGHGVLRHGEAVALGMLAETRYAHSRGYIERMAARSGFAVRFYERAALRLENHRPVRGQLFVLQLS